MVKKISLDEIGSLIQKNYEKYVKDNWDYIKSQLETLYSTEDLSDDERDLYDVLAYFSVKKDTLEICLDYVGLPDFWQGTSQTEYWVASFVIFKNTSQEQMLEFDCAGASYYYDDPDCYENEHLFINGLVIPLKNIIRVLIKEDIIEIAYTPRELFAKTQTIRLSTEWTECLERELEGEVSITRSS